MASTSDVRSEEGPVFFWKPDPPNGYLSQWYPSPFHAPTTDPSLSASTMTFDTTEQYMMYHKAILFKDTEIADAIMKATTPRKQQALGKQVKNFDGNVWNENKEKIVEEGNWNKFTNPVEDEGLRKILIETGQRELVEASPTDRIWGVGYDAKNAEANRANWGENLLGKVLMRVRARLKDAEKLPS